MDMKSLQTLFLLLFLGMHCVMAQENDVPKVNHLNEKGNREGLWIEEYESVRFFTYYHDGKKNGPFYEISRSKNLPSIVGTFTNDIYSGVWYYFRNDDGTLFYVLRDFKKFEHPKYGYKFQCYCIDYYPNGNKQGEGIWLFVDEPQSDTTSEFGEWKYYNEDGSLKEIKKMEVFEVLKSSNCP